MKNITNFNIGDLLIHGEHNVYIEYVEDIVFKEGEIYLHVKGIYRDNEWQTCIYRLPYETFSFSSHVEHYRVVSENK